MDNDFAGLLFPSDWLRLSQDVLEQLPSNIHGTIHRTSMNWTKKSGQ